MVKYENKKGETMKKLEWYEDEDVAFSYEGEDEAKVWRATYDGKEGSFDLEVYPASLIDKKLKGWEYRIITEDSSGYGVEYDSMIESSNAEDHAPDLKVAMKWAEETLEEILEKRRSRR